MNVLKGLGMAVMIFLAVIGAIVLFFFVACMATLSQLK